MRECSGGQSFVLFPALLRTGAPPLHANAKGATRLKRCPDTNDYWIGSDTCSCTISHLPSCF
jgi:hypothetical protein